MKTGMLTGLWFVADGAGVVESLRQAAGLGFRYVDLHGVFHAGPAHLPPAERPAVRAEMAALGLEPRALTPGPGPPLSEREDEFHARLHRFARRLEFPLAHGVEGGLVKRVRALEDPGRGHTSVLANDHLDLHRPGDLGVLLTPEFSGVHLC